jgi:hypothetical protein
MRGSRVKALRLAFRVLYGKYPERAVWSVLPGGGWEVKGSVFRKFKRAYTRRELPTLPVRPTRLPHGEPLAPEATEVIHPATVDPEPAAL